MNKSKILLFTDFDGTITHKDVGDAIFERFLRSELLEQGWHEQIINEWISGRVTSQDCLLRECEQTVVTEEELKLLHQWSILIHLKIRFRSLKLGLFFYVF